MDAGDSLLDGSDADGEWSEGTDMEEDQHLSDAQCSETEDFGYHSKSSLCKHCKYGQCADHCDDHTDHQDDNSDHQDDHTDRRDDHTDLLMGHIDQQLLSMATLQVPVKTQRRLSKSERSFLKDEGVMFDTGDDTAHETSHPRPGGVPMIKVSKSSLDRDGTIDTGLGTGSYQEDQMSGDQHKIIGSIHTYSDGTESSASNLSEDEMSDNGNNRPKGAHPGDLDSDAALQVDHKYKQILKHKRGGYLKGFKGHKGRQSDLDSVRTEDFEEMFQDFMIMPTLKETSPDRSSQSKDKRKGNKKEMEEASPSKLNNPHKEYKNALLAAGLLLERYGYPLPEDLADLGGVGKPVGQMKSKRRRKGNGSGPSDHESVRTEDYENHFHNMMVKQVAHVPITSFDQLIVDSDLETVKSLLVHTKFQNALNKSGMTDASEMSSSDAESAISMGRYAPHKADMMKLMGMDPAASEKLHANPESDAKLKPSKHSHKRNSNSHRRQRGSWQREGSESQSRRSSTHSSASTFEEVESLNLSRSHSSESSNSFGLLRRGSSPRSLDMESTGSSRDFTPGMYTGRMMLMDYGPPPTSSNRYNFRKQVSTDRSSVTTSNSRSSFDEVESIDFGGQHDIDIDPYILREYYLSKKMALDDADKTRDLENEQDSSAKKQSSSHDKKRGLRHSSSTDDSSKKSDEDGGSRRRRGRDLIIPEDEDTEIWQRDKEKQRKSSHDSHSSGDYNQEKSLLDQLMEYKQPRSSRSSDTQSNTSSFSPSSAASAQGETVNKLPYENDYEFHVRKRRMSTSSVTSGHSFQSSSGSGPSRPGLSRTMSMESSSSSFSSSSPSDPYYYYNQPANAEDVLLNLGFCTSDSFLPERFARDWFNKIMVARRERIQQFQDMEIADMLEGLDTPASRSQSGKSTPLRRRGSTSEFLHKLDVNSRTLASTRRSKFRRAATMMAYHQEDLDKLHHDNPEKGHINVEKQDSIDQLKYVLERQASILNDSPKDRRRRQFATSRQKSLPLCLETLSEEEEGRASRGPSIDKGRLKSFLEEEERLSRSSSKDSDLSKASGDAYNKDSRKKRGSDASSVVSSDFSDDVECQAKELKQSQPIETFITLPSEKICQEPEPARSSVSQLPRKSIPSIVVSGNRYLPPQSSASLEIVEIMEPTNRISSKRDGVKLNLNTYLNVEPAMISVVLSDVEDCESEKGRSPLNPSHSEDLLCPPSPSLSASPIPISPVTVIEMELLDNINDSMDSGDSLGDINQPAISSQSSALMLDEMANMSTLHPISEEELLSSDASRQTSFDDSQSLIELKPPAQSEKLRGNSVDSGSGSCQDEWSPVMTADFGVEANDGRLSPIVMFASSKHLQVSTSPDAVSQCESAYGSFVDDRYKDTEEVIKELRDVGIQNDDGTLSPIMFCPQGEWLPSEEAYLASDQATQYELVLMDSQNNLIGVACMETQTDSIGYTTSSTQTPEWLSKLISQNTADFEPMCICCNVACQTDEQEMFKQQSLPIFPNILLCNSCGKKVHMGSDMWSSEDTFSDMPRSLALREGTDTTPRPLDVTIQRLAKKTNNIKKRTSFNTSTDPEVSDQPPQIETLPKEKSEQALSHQMSLPLPYLDRPMRDIIEEPHRLRSLSSDSSIKAPRGSLSSSGDIMSPEKPPAPCHDTTSKDYFNKSHDLSHDTSSVDQESKQCNQEEQEEPEEVSEICCGNEKENTGPDIINSSSGYSANSPSSTIQSQQSLKGSLTLVDSLEEGDCVETCEVACGGDDRLDETDDDAANGDDDDDYDDDNDDGDDGDDDDDTDDVFVGQLQGDPHEGLDTFADAFEPFNPFETIQHKVFTPPWESENDCDNRPWHTPHIDSPPELPASHLLPKRKHSLPDKPQELKKSEHDRRNISKGKSVDIPQRQSVDDEAKVRLRERRRSSLQRQPAIQLSSLALQAPDPEPQTLEDPEPQTLEDPEETVGETWAGWPSQRSEEYPPEDVKRNAYIKDTQDDNSNWNIPPRRHYFLPDDSSEDISSMDATSKWVDNHAFIDISSLSQSSHDEDNNIINSNLDTENSQQNLNVETSDWQLEKSSSTEKSSLAASIVTDLFQSVAFTDASTDTSRILTEIAMDYSVMKAVNNTIDKVLLSPSESSKSYAETFAEVDDLIMKAEQISSRRLTVGGKRHHQYKTCSHGGEDAGHRHSAPSRQLSGSTPNLATVGLTSNTKEGLGYYETQRTIRELNQLTSTTEKARREKQSALEELKSVQKILERNRSDIRQTERLLKENRAKAEDVRTQLVLVEFKRDSAQKDLQTLTEELQNTHHRLREGGCEWEETGSGGMTREQVSTLIAENEMLKARSGGELLGLERSGSDLMGLERRELQRQLETTKQELFAEQKRFRDKMEALQEDLDTRTSQYEEAVSAQEELVKKQAKLDAMHKQMEKDKNAIIQMLTRLAGLNEKSQEYDDLKDRLEKHIAESRSSSNHQTVELNQQITDLTDRLTKCQAEMGSKETLTMQLREQILELQAEINQETEAKEILAEESKKNRENLHKEKVEAVEDVRKLADKEKTAALESQRQLLEAQHLQLLAQAEQQLLRQMNDIQTKLSARAVELDVVKERLGQQESMARDVGERVRQETQEHIRSMLELEHQRALSERDREIQHQISDIKDNAERNNRQLQNELLQERDLVDKQERQINALKQELEEQRDQNRQLYREKLSTMNEIKESAELVREREIDNIRTQVEKDIHRQMDRLRETVRKQEAEIDRFRTERQEQLTRERETVAAMDKLERGIVSDLNEECRKVAEMIGVTPRRANIPGFSAYWTANKTGLSMQSPTRMALNAAVSNLRSGNDELKKHVNDTRQELEKAKHSVKRSEAQKMEELELLRQKMQKEKAQALDILKDRLIKEHIEEVDKLHKSVGKGKTLHKNLHEKDIELRDIQRNMIKWREETANKLAVKFQEEMNRQLEKRLREYKRREKEWEKEKAAHQREVEQMETELRRTTMNAINVYGTPTRPSRLSRPPSPALSLHDRSLSAEGGNVRQLQIKVKQLQHENSSLRGGNYGNRMSSSTSDLTAAHLYSDQREPEHRVRQAESRAKVAEHRAEQNEVMLNQKIHENSKMQGSLTQQSKELMQLERAYSLLQNRTAVHSLHNSLRS